MRLLSLLLGLAFVSPGLSQGDAVPAGALQRLGTSRFRAEHPIQQVAYMPDGRTLVGCTHFEIYLWDADSGELKRRWTINDDLESRSRQGFGRDRFALNPKGHLLAVEGTVEGKRELQYWEPATGRKVFAKPAAGSGRTTMEWTPDGSRLVIITPGLRGSDFLLIRDEKGAILPRNYTWSPTDYSYRLKVVDNRRAIFSSAAEKPRLIDLETGVAEREFDVEVKNRAIPQVAVVPGGRRLAFISPTGLLFFNTDTGQPDGKMALQQLNARSPATPHFSPDGKTIYLQNGQVVGLETETARETFRLELPNDTGQSLGAISPDGRRICTFNRTDHVVHQTDVTTGKEILPPPGHAHDIHPFWLPDNRTLLVRARRERVWSVWDASRGERTRQFEKAHPKGEMWTPGAAIALSGDGRTLIDFNSEFPESEIQTWDVPSGRRTPLAVPLAPQTGSMFHLAFSPRDGRVLSWEYAADTGENNHRLYKWWPLTGRESGNAYQIEVRDGYEIEARGPHLLHYATRSVFGNDDEETDADKFTLRVHRASDGKLARTLDFAGRLAKPVAATPQGDLILTESRRYERTGYLSPQEAQRFALWEFASGERIREWPLPPLALAGAISPKADFVLQAFDYRHFAIRDPYLTHEAIRTFEVPSRVESFHFSPNGSRLLTVLADTTMVVWDCSTWSAEVAKSLASKVPGELPALWNDMAGPADKAFAAARTLSLAGDGAVEFLKEKIVPAKLADEAKIGKWIADLDADKFATRERASKELEQVGWWSEALLKQTLAGKPTPEVRARLEKLIDRIDRQRFDATTLRELRATRALVWIGTPESKKLLEELAKGDGRSPVTQAAKGMLP